MWYVFFERIRIPNDSFRRYQLVLVVVLFAMVLALIVRREPLCPTTVVLTALASFQMEHCNHAHLVFRLRYLLFFSFSSD